MMPSFLSNVTEMRNNMRDFSQAIISADVDVKGVVPDDIECIDLAETCRRGGFL
jgi:hypothetical protein